MHGPNRTLAAVPTRRGPQCNYSRYSAFVHLSPSSPSHSPAQAPFHTCTPVCHETHTRRHYTHPGRRGCMLAHAHRHLPYIQRPHTRCFSHTRGFSYTRGFTHARHDTHAMRAFSTHFAALVNTHTRTITLGIRTTTRGPGASIPPSSACTHSQHSPPLTRKARSAFAWSRSALREHSVSLRSCRRLSCCLHRATNHSTSSPSLSLANSMCVCVRL